MLYDLQQIEIFICKIDFSHKVMQVWYDFTDNITGL